VTPEIFAKRLLKKPSATIAEALMNQGGVSGVGNYIKAECLYRARISPWRKVSDITSGEYVNLCEATLNVARESYQSQGASIYTYTNPDEHKGSMQFNFCAYAQSTCPKGHDIRNEETPEGRTSWWCPACQN
jgi:formamidopyrimidine-DNA glycosylase